MASEAKKKKNREDLRHYIKIILAVFLLVLGAAMAVFSYRLGRLVFTDDAVADSSVDNITYEITITPGESTLAVGFELMREDVIPSASAFLIQSKIYKCKIAPGTYTVYSKMSSKEIIKYLNQEFLRKQKEGEGAQAEGKG